MNTQTTSTTKTVVIPPPEKKKEKTNKISPCNENTFIIDGNKINPVTGLSNKAKILME